MAKLEIEMPEKYDFSTELTIRRIDLALDLHVSFSTILELVNEGYLQFFEYLGYPKITEIDGTSVIFANAQVVYLAELAHGDKLKIEVAAENFSEKSCDLIFRLSKKDGTLPAAHIKIRVLFFDYTYRKVTRIPEKFKNLFKDKIENKPEASSSLASFYPEHPAWKEAHNFTLSIYKLSTKLPESEKENFILRLKKLSFNIPVWISESAKIKDRDTLIKLYSKIKNNIEELKYSLILIYELEIADTTTYLSQLESLSISTKNYFLNSLQKEI